MLTFLKRAIDPYRMLDYPDVPDFAASETPTRSLHAHMTRIDVVRAHNLRASRLLGRAIDWVLFGGGLVFLASILVAVI